MLRDNLQKKNSSQRIKMGIQLDHTQEQISVTKKVSKSHKKRGKYWIDLGLVLKKNLGNW